MHLRRSDSSNLSLLTYTSDRVGGYLDVPIYGISMLGNEATDLVSIDLSFLKDYTCSESVKVVGSSNGLVCLVTGVHCNEAKDMDGVEISEIIIWNPATRQCRVVPKPLLAENINFRPATSTFGFGFSDNHNTNDYKIVGIFHNQVQVFTRSSNCWRQVEGSVFPSHNDYFRGDSICLNGVLYWMAPAISDTSFERLVLSFNLRDEALDVIQLPSTGGVLDRRLLSWKNSLAFTCVVAFGINEIQGWAKTSDDSDESTGTWTKPFSIDSSILSAYGRIIGIWKDQVLIQSVTINGFGLFLYDPKTETRGQCLPKPEAMNYYNAKLVNYVESLVLV